MLFLGNLLQALATVVDSVLFIVMILIIARVIISWVNADPYNPIVRFISTSTEPMMRPVRRFVPSFGGLDWSPLVLLLFVVFLRVFLVQSLEDHGKIIRRDALTASVAVEWVKRS